MQERKKQKSLRMCVFFIRFLDIIFSLTNFICFLQRFRVTVQMLVHFSISPNHRGVLYTVFGGAFICFAFIAVVDRWATHSRIGLRPRPAGVLGSNGGELSGKGQSDLLQNKSRWNAFPLTEDQWEEEYQKRVERVREVCEKDEMVAMRRVWRVAANRRWGKDTFCKSHMCPIIIDEANVLFFCTIPKVASTRVKEFFLNISEVHLNETFLRNATALHTLANVMLHRVSPMFYPSSTARRFFKVMFVRHPFDRLASVFRSTAEASREQIGYFYDTYWNKVMTTLRGQRDVRNTSQITFPEFAWYLKNTVVSDYNEHWTPYTSRCDPCLVDYDFIGKLETADHDFPYAFGKVDIENTRNWWSSIDPNSRSISLKYFSQLKENDIWDLYKIYRTDFLLFGYTVDDFIPSKSTKTN